MRSLMKTGVATIALLASVASFAANHQFSALKYIDHVKYLASEELGGRGNGTEGLEKAADYVAKHFQEAGLQPAGQDNTWYQKFTLAVGSQLGPGNKLTLRIGDKTLEGVLGKSFAPFGMGKESRISGDIVFAGYGISSEEPRYDDYRNLEYVDKVVLVMAHEPRENDPASPFNGREPTMHSQDNTKALAARYGGARALLVVQDPLNHPASPDEVKDATRAGEVSELGICALRISTDLADAILSAQGKRLVDVQKEIDEKMAPQSFAIGGARADIELDVTTVRKEVRNVVGALPGTDAAVGRETVILGAHYDHLGKGGRTSMSPQLIGETHNGADDNASGTAGLIELAYALAKDPAPRKRGYLFIAFAGEEIGLNGSAYWANHPTYPLDRAVAMLNLDMIGRPRNNVVLLGGIGTSPAFAEIIRTAAAEAGIEAKPSSQGGYGSSDHASFYMKSLPVLFFFSGLHGDYHRPSDDWQLMDGPGAVKIVEMVYGVATRLNILDARPQFTKVDEPAGGARQGAGGSGYGVSFGSVPDMAADVQGVRFADVRPNSPAAKAGLKGGDTLVRFDGKDVKSLEDFSYMLRTHKPGDVVDVVVMRDGQPMTVQVKLDIRR